MHDSKVNIVDFLYLIKKVVICPATHVNDQIRVDPTCIVGCLGGKKGQVINC